MNFYRNFVAWSDWSMALSDKNETYEKELPVQFILKFVQVI